MIVLNEISTRRSQVENLGNGAEILIPLTVVHGSSEHHDKKAYSAMISAAFPEYFSGIRSPKNANTVTELLAHLMVEHHLDHSPKPKENEHTPQLSLQDFTLFLPDDPRYATSFHVSGSDKTVGPLIEKMITQANTGNQQAKNALIEMAKNDAIQYAKDLKIRGILNATRFVQFGLHTEAFKNSPRYTYLEWGKP